MGKHDDLVLAVRKGDLQGVIKLLGKTHGSMSKLMGSCKKLNANQLDSSGYAPLHYSALAGNIDVTKALLDYGAAVDVIDGTGIRPIHLAAEGGYIDVVSSLLQRGANANEPAYDGSTPLHGAAAHGHDNIVELLLAHGADPTTYNGARKTALDLACEYGREKVVDLLLEGTNGLCVKQLLMGDADTTDSIHTTSCLHLASRNGYLNIVSRLLDVGCDINRRTREGTCLHEAVANGHVDIVSLLLSRGVDMNCVNSHKQTALDVASRLPASRANVPLRQLLQKLYSQQPCRSSPQHFAKSFGDIREAYSSSSTDNVIQCSPNIPCTCLLKSASAKNISQVSSNMSAGCHAPQCQLFQSSADGSCSPVPDVVSQCKSTVLRRPSEPLVSSSSHYGGSSPVKSAPRSPALQCVVAPIRSSTDLSQDCGSIVLHASFDSTPVEPAPCHLEPHLGSIVGGLAHRRLVVPRSRSPVDQILPADDVGDRSRAGRGTDSPGSTSGTSSTSSGSSGYPASLCHAVTGLPPSGSNVWTRQQHRLSGHSCESGVASLTSSRHSYLSVASSSSHSSLNRLAEDDESAYSSVVNFSELYDNGFSESDILRSWLCEIHLEDCYDLFDNAGYDMPTISRMTPEDLTAIGITQPAIRKRLTLEISRLRINDGIPNYKPSDLLDWLQLLRLECYYDVLVRDGYYNDIDRVTDITWEDLEEIGIKKLGHQKKIMLAIDRLKKLKSGRRTDADHYEDPLFMSASQTGLGPSAVTAAVSHHQLRSVSRENVGPPHSPMFPNYQTDFAARGMEIVHLPPQIATPSACHPEVVAIQVRRSTPTGMPPSAEIPRSPAGAYESFHSNAANDANRFVYRTENTGDNVMTASDDGSTLCRDANPSRQYELCRIRRASGGTTPTSKTSNASPACRRGSHLPNGDHNVFTFPTSVTVGSAPTTPLRGHTPLMAGSSVRKIPPAPPRRTNSIKVEGVASSMGRGSTADRIPAKPMPASSQSFDADKVEWLASNDDVIFTDSYSDAADGGRIYVDNNQLNDIEMQQCGTLKRQPERRRNEAQFQQAPDANGGVIGDCGTLPFANENVGTIRPRGGSSHSGRTPTKTADFNDAEYEEATGTVRRRVVPKKPPVQQADVSNSSTDSNDVTTTSDSRTSCDNVITGETSSRLFSEIGDLFDGLTNELEELLLTTPT